MYVYKENVISIYIKINFITRETNQRKRKRDFVTHKSIHIIFSFKFKDFFAKHVKADTEINSFSLYCNKLHKT